MIEWGVFNDGGCLEGQCWSQQEAEQRIAEDYSDDEWAYVAKMCPDHDSQPERSCDDCFAEVSA